MRAKTQPAYCNHEYRCTGSGRGYLLQGDRHLHLPMATTWVNLLRKNGLDTPARSSAARQSSRVGLGRGVTVSEKTPQAKVGTKKSTTRSKEGSSVQVLRSQIADLLREKRQLADKVCDRAGVRVPQCMWRGCTCEESVKCEENGQCV